MTTNTRNRKPATPKVENVDFLTTFKTWCVERVTTELATFNNADVAAFKANRDEIEKVKNLINLLVTTHDKQLDGIRQTKGSDYMEGASRIFEPRGRKAGEAKPKTVAEMFGL